MLSKAGIAPHNHGRYLTRYEQQLAASKEAAEACECGATCLDACLSGLLQMVTCNVRRLVMYGHPVESRTPI